jgi:hypothetical protein
MLIGLVQEKWRFERGNDDDPYPLTGRVYYAGEYLRR